MDRPNVDSRFKKAGRVYLSAETATEMNEWISGIRSVMTTLRAGHNRKSSTTKSIIDTKEVKFSSVYPHVRPRPDVALLLLQMLNAQGVKIRFGRGVGLTTNCEKTYLKAIKSQQPRRPKFEFDVADR